MLIQNAPIAPLRSIIKIQAAIRGALVRLRLQKIRRMLTLREEAGGTFDLTITESAFFFNPRVKEVYKRDGPYQLEKKTDMPIDLVEKEPYRMTSGVIYQGQWTADLKYRTGYGRQSWLDGSIYEGQWRNGQSHGLGRLIHADGDVY